MIRPAIAEVIRLGPLPPSNEATVEELQEIQEAIQRVERPVTLEEARALIRLFGQDDCFGLAWALVTLVESAPGWPTGVNLSGNAEWISLLRTRAVNAGLYPMIAVSALAFVGALAWEFPALRALMAEHLRDNFGELIPHVLMGDYRRWAETLTDTDPAELRRFLDFLEIAVEDADESVVNLIDVSFVEQLPYPDEPGSAIRDMLGPRLCSMLSHGT